MSEQDYINGSQQAWLTMLKECCRQLGEMITRPSWIIERQETVLTLRRVCAEYGDNDWPDDLHLSDVVEKHLERHLEPLHDR